MTSKNLIVGTDPDDPDRVLVFDLRTKKQRGLSFDAARNLGLLDRAAPVNSMPSTAPQWIAIAPPRHLPISVHPQARFSCEGAGTCCESGMSIPLTKDEAQRVQSAARAGDRDPVCLRPSRPGAPFTRALSADPRCTFLSTDKRCTIHDTGAQPSACRVFPFRFAAAIDRVHASIAHRCVCGTLDRGEKLADLGDSMRARYDAVAEVHAVPPRTAIDGERWIESREAVRALVSATEESDPFAILDVACARLLDGSGSGSDLLRARRQRPLSANEVSGRMVRALPPVVAADPKLPLGRALRGEAHPRSALIASGLRRIDVGRDDPDVLAEVGRFIRDWMFALEPYRFSTLAVGLVAAGLAANRILTGLPREAPHPTARARIMLWESAFLAPSLRDLLGPHGPLAERLADLSAVREQLRRFSRITRAGRSSNTRRTASESR